MLTSSGASSDGMRAVAWQRTCRARGRRASAAARPSAASAPARRPALRQRVEAPDLDRAEVSRAQQVRVLADADERLPREQVEAFLERVHVRRDGAADCELIHAQPCVHGAARVVDERRAACSPRCAVRRAMARPKRRRRRASDVVHG